MIDCTSAVYGENETKLSLSIRSGMVYDNNVIDCLDLVYVEIETELLGIISLGTVYDENQT